jgi:type IV pilus assembly protein PilQ
VVKSENLEDRQIFLDLVDVSAKPRVIREFDTSQFSGGAIFVRAYPQSDNNDNLRVAVQLRENVGSRISKDSNKVTLVLENRFGPLVQDEQSRIAIDDLDEELEQIEIEQDLAFNSSEVNGSAKKSANNGSAAKSSAAKSSAASSSGAAQAGSKSIPRNGDSATKESARRDEPSANGLNVVHVPRSNALEDILYNITLSGEKQYVGKKITINVRNTPVENILTMIADSSGFNIITSSKVKVLPNLTLYLVNTPWDQVLDIIIELNNLVVKKNGPILMIQTFEEASNEKKEKLAAERLQEDRGPVVTKIFPISYANLADLSKVVQGYLTVNQGKVTEDKRTNSLIVKDSPEVIERLRRIVETLDTQTPQVLIESKIVEVSETYNIKIGLGGSGINTIVNTKAGDASASGVFNISSLATPSFLQATISSLGNVTGLDFSLQMMETESKGRIIANPKIVAQNNKEAVISTNERRYYSKTTRDTTTNEETVDYDSNNITMELKVTPQVTNEGAIILDVDLKKDHFTSKIAEDSPYDTATRSIKTNVLVDNGSTIVLGGVYSYQDSETVSGVPLLKNIPIIGWLFRSVYAPTKEKTELIIFITPRIINQENAGLINNVDETIET